MWLLQGAAPARTRVVIVVWRCTTRGVDYRTKMAPFFRLCLRKGLDNVSRFMPVKRPFETMGSNRRIMPEKKDNQGSDCGSKRGTYISKKKNFKFLCVGITRGPVAGKSWLG